MTSIKERPILFSAPMVRALLEGRKTVTRRAMKVQPVLNGKLWQVYGAGWSEGVISVPAVPGHSLAAKCPYGQIGDRLWVRETTEVDEKNSSVVRLARYSADGEPVLYRHPEGDEYNGTVAHWDYPRRSRPSIHMPRWASRILLEITDVRVERLQDISEEQALAEGIIPHVRGGWHWHPHDPANVDDWHQFGFKTPYWAFHDLWTGINGTDSWNANPWVWVVEFKQVNSSTACGYTNGDWECREGGYLWNAGDGEGYDPTDCTYICPHCRTADYLEAAKEDAEACSSWSNNGTSGTGVDLWVRAENHALAANEFAARKALAELGPVSALEGDDSPEGYSVVICNSQQVTP